MNRIVVEYPCPEDAEAIKSIQDSWVGTRVGSEGFLLSPEPLDRLRDIIRSRNILVARRGDTIVAYITFYRRGEWEMEHPGYASKLVYRTARLREAYERTDYVLIDHIARNRGYSGEAAIRLVAKLKALLREWDIGVFMGEISPENLRSAAFFTKALRAIHIASTVRNDVPWDVYAASVL